jgi:hypothetical protein
MTDLIMGYARGYDWSVLKYWVNSIQATGFSGDIVIVSTSMDAWTISELQTRNVIVRMYGSDDGKGNFHAEASAAPHVERFFYLWEYLDQNQSKYQNVFVTDTRDVIFQEDPVEHIDPDIGYYWTMLSSEGMKYKDEPWGAKNYQDTFGPYFWDRIKDQEILNVGVLAGGCENIRHLLQLIFQMSLGRPIPVVDQAVYNFIIREGVFEHALNTEIDTDNSDAWAIQLGTTRFAVEAGAGDLGQIYGQNPTKLIQYEMLYNDSQPIIEGDGTVSHPDGEKFAVVHQWDRVPDLKEKVEKKYGS